MARLSFFFFTSPRHFDFLDCKTETSKVFCVRARDVQTLKMRAPDLVESYENELVQKSYKGSFCCKPLYETSDLKICQQSINSIFFLAMTYFWSGGCTWLFPLDFFD